MVEQWSPKPPMNVRFVPAPPRCCGRVVRHLSAEQGTPVQVWTAPPNYDTMTLVLTTAPKSKNYP